ncbi:MULTISPECIES: DUF6672 family protein [Cetobacterium]|jgi:hypothetical protein|uniref:AMIN domain-containing protein n=1 Tax=Candidatus Cetobacterium colombiensis TaxID=3073100 RepID=A0ABU4W8K4_9FUSO|nr:DUF6672 family protein [Candidatus Cetobacterium colombiensis]MDX8335377.1 hypothetical protein [Candidatus Cetobacterium colombiensis]
MRKKISITLFFVIVIIISWGFYSSGQEHTLIINNIYTDKQMSKNLIIKVDGGKDKKLGKNKKIVMDLKGLNHKFLIEIDGEKKEGIIKFNLNKSAELKIENFLTDNGDWLKEINQY